MSISLKSLTALTLSIALPITSWAGAPAAPTCSFSGSTFFSNAGAIAIPDNNTGLVTSQIVVSGAPAYLWDLDVTTFVRHTSPNDIDMTITSPSGKTVTLTSDNGGSSDNVFSGTLWDDQANPGGQVPYPNNPGLVTDAVYNSNLVAPALVPEEPLNAFQGENPNGVWTLTISDDTAVETGALLNWGIDLVALPQAPTKIEFTVSNDTNVPISGGSASVVSSSIAVSDPSFLFICGMKVNTRLTHSFSADIDMTLQSPSGRVVTLTTDNGGGTDNVFADTLWQDDAAAATGILPYVNQTASVTDALYTNAVNNPFLSPEEPLGAFNGEVANGNWTLTISDDASVDGGLLDFWSITFTRCLELDSDSDALPNSCDECPLDASKFASGQCGCGISDVDDDADGTANCNDSCSADPLKTNPGQCGCGVVDVDANTNGIADCRASSELKVRLTRGLTILGRVKVVNGRITQAGAAARRNLLNLLKDINNYVVAQQSTIAVASGRNLNSLHTKVQNQVKRAMRTLKNKDRKAAADAIKKLRSSLVE